MDLAEFKSVLTIGQRVRFYLDGCIRLSENKALFYCEYCEKVVLGNVSGHAENLLCPHCYDALNNDPRINTILNEIKGMVVKAE